jgi:hypothetical protein
MNSPVQYEELGRWMKPNLIYSNQTQENEQVCFSLTESTANTVAVVGAP